MTRFMEESTSRRRRSAANDESIATSGRTYQTSQNDHNNHGNSSTLDPVPLQPQIQISFRFPRRRDNTRSDRLLTMSRSGDCRAGKILRLGTVLRGIPTGRKP